MNKVIMIGRLTRDPVIRYSQGEKTVCVARYAIAVPKIYKHEGEPDVDFFNCVAFGHNGEFTEKYFKKGTKIALNGRLQNSNYTNKDGVKVNTVEIYVEEQEFAESKQATDRNHANNAPVNNMPANNTYQTAYAPRNTNNHFQQQAGRQQTQYNGQSGRNYQANGNSGMPQRSQANNYQQQSNYSNGFMNIPDDYCEDLPFK